ncbi:MAG: hypothetical protein AAFZ15_17060 [Bacteroidota bacterium]
MQYSKYLLLVFFYFLLFQKSTAQDFFMEAGIGIGNITGKEHKLGKSEIHLNIFRSFKFGQLGLDFSTGGNFIPGESTTTEPGVEVLSAADSKFSSVVLLYRLPIKNHFFIEPRLGYASLSAFVHTDDKTKINESNLSAGIGFGGTIKKLTLSLRYQYLGKTAEYEGSKDSIVVKSFSEQVSLVLLRISYCFDLNSIFKKNNNF